MHVQNGWGVMKKWEYVTITLRSAYSHGKLCLRVLLFKCDCIFCCGDDIVCLEVIHFKQLERVARASEAVLYTDANHRHGASAADRLRNGAAESAQYIVLLRRYDATGLLCRLQDGLLIQRLDRVHVDHA